MTNRLWRAMGALIMIAMLLLLGGCQTTAGVDISGDWTAPELDRMSGAATMKNLLDVDLGSPALRFSKDGSMGFVYGGRDMTTVMSEAFKTLQMPDDVVQAFHAGTATLSYKVEGDQLNFITRFGEDEIVEKTAFTLDKDSLRLTFRGRELTLTRVK